MKILLVGAGRRVSLAQRFVQQGFEVLAYETDVHAPIQTVAKLIPGLGWNHPDLAEHLLEVCATEQIGLILPLQDKATVALASVKFPSTVTVITSSAEANAICLDKRKFEEFVLNDTWLKEFYPAVNSTAQDKVIGKPVQGCNSQGITIFEKTQMPYLDPEYWVAQDYIANGTEISVDAYFDRQSRLIDAVPRLRLAVQGGEVSKSQTLERHAYGLYDLTKLLGEKIGLTGPGCFQYILDSQEFPFIMEVNARFGGGVILSLESGLDFIELIKKEYVLGETVPSQPYLWRAGFGMNRYFSEFFYV